MTARERSAFTRVFHTSACLSLNRACNRISLLHVSRRCETSLNLYMSRDSQGSGDEFSSSRRNCVIGLGVFFKIPTQPPTIFIISIPTFTSFVFTIYSSSWLLLEFDIMPKSKTMQQGKIIIIILQQGTRVLILCTFLCCGSLPFAGCSVLNTSPVRYKLLNVGPRLFVFSN